MTTVVINGEARDVPEGLTIEELLAELGVAEVTAAVERNGDIVSRDRFSGVTIEGGDELELVRLMGGG